MNMVRNDARGFGQAVYFIALCAVMLFGSFVTVTPRAEADPIVENVQYKNGQSGRFLIFNSEAEGSGINTTFIDAILDAGHDNSIVGFGYSIGVTRSTVPMTVQGQVVIRGRLNVGPSGHTFSAPSMNQDYGYMTLGRQAWNFYNPSDPGLESDTTVVFLNIDPFHFEGATLSYTEYPDPSSPGDTAFVYRWSFWGWLGGSESAVRGDELIFEEWTVPSPGTTALSVTACLTMVRRRRS